MFHRSQPLLAALALAKSSPCRVDSDSLQCRLLDYLHLLQVIGAVLAVLLAVVLAFAVQSWIASRDAIDLPKSRSKSPKGIRR